MCWRRRAAFCSGRDCRSRLSPRLAKARARQPRPRRLLCARFAGKQFNGFPGDIWALGICLFMFVFGKPPFVGATTFQIYEAIQRAELSFPHEIPVSGELKVRGQRRRRRRGRRRRLWGWGLGVVGR